LNGEFKLEGYRKVMKKGSIYVLILPPMDMKYYFEPMIVEKLINLLPALHDIIEVGKGYLL
jgi:hypothetical protein